MMNMHISHITYHIPRIPYHLPLNPGNNSTNPTNSMNPMDLGLTKTIQLFNYICVHQFPQKLDICGKENNKYVKGGNHMKGVNK